MDLSASSRLITSALTSLDVPPHEYEEDVQDEIHLDGGKDDNDSSQAATVAFVATQDPSKDPEVSNCMDSSLIIPVPPYSSFLTSTPTPLPASNPLLTNGTSLGPLNMTIQGQDSSNSCIVSPNMQVTSSAEDDSKSTGDLVLAAISVMKGRKARPDTKRLCNWVHRKYGRSVGDVVNEIDNLCAQGILEKVEYKGSISFRIVSDKKLHKRAGRRKSNNVNNDTSNGDLDKPKLETPKKTPGPAKKSPKKIVEKSPDGAAAQPLTINFIVTEELKPAPEAVVSKNDIIQAIETSSRPINKKNVFRDLETILAQEIHLGYLKKVNDDGFTLPSIENSKTYRGTIALKVSKRKPKPTQKLLDMEADNNKVKSESVEDSPDGENNENKNPTAPRTEDQLKDDLIKEKLISNKLFKMKNKIKATKSKIRKEKMLNSLIQNELKPLETGIDALHEKQNNLKISLEDVLESTEDNVKSTDAKEDKNINVLKKKKETWQTTDKKEKNQIEKERKNHFVEKPNEAVIKRRRRKKVEDKAENNGAVAEVSNKKKSLTAQKSRSSHQNSKETKNQLVLDDEDDRGSSDGPQRSVSARKKRARKIFDPADHDLPQRIAKKGRTSSPIPYQDDKVTSNKRGVAGAVKRRGKPRQSKSLDQESDPDTDACLYCDQGDLKNEKLITCKDCSTTVHPSCLNYPEDLTDQIYAQPWQCINCKTCFVCKEAGDDEQMLFCDSCDLGYHMMCHQPPISSKPQGRWECSTCAKHTGFEELMKPPLVPELPLEKQFESELPPLPPGTGGSWQERGIKMRFCPLPDMSPADWESLPIDETIPDISSWSAARVSQYLVQNGIQETHAKVFFDEEIDGSSVLVMQRMDIVKGLGLKLGPALKIYNRVRTLQTRRKMEVF